MSKNECAEFIVTDEKDFFSRLEQDEKLFGTFTLPDGRVVCGFRKIKGAMYDSEKGFGVLLHPDDVRHMINVLRMARRDSRKTEYERKNKSADGG